MIQILRIYIGGFLMGMADVVPGVSGGTIALIIGVYERLIASVREGSSALGSLLRGNVDDFLLHLRRVDWMLLVPLLAGILSAVLLLASFIDHQIEERPTIVAGLFLGLVFGSILIAWRLIKTPDWRDPAIVVIVGAITFYLLGFGEHQAASDPALIAFLGAGSLAICAMILPGISGSLILLMLGMYKPVLDAVNERDLVTVVVFGCGAVIGLALFSQILGWSLEHYHDLVMAALIGLMLGSTRVLWPWPEGVESAELGKPGDDWPTVLAMVVIGVLLPFVITRLSPTNATPTSETEQEMETTRPELRPTGGLPDSRV